jgi:putative hemolysin
MSRKSINFIGLLLVILFVTACQPKADMPNPASVFCEENGGTLEIRTDEETGDQVGYCVFEDGSECEEWAFYRGECKPGDSLDIADMPNPASVFCEENGGTLEIRTDEETGDQVGYCVFEDGSECEEWAFYRGECKPGDSLDIADMPNPASVFCEENGGTLEIRTDEETGGQVGYCVFEDGSECEEWAFFNGECQPGDSIAGIGMPNPAAVFCEENGGTVEIKEDEEGNQYGYCRFGDGSACDEWAFFRGECLVGGIYPIETLAEDGCKIYSNDILGYSFHFMADALIISKEDPMSTVTVQGPLVDDEYWPMIFFNHPYDQPEYLITEDADLEEWMEENNLLVGERLADRTIAGESAVHLRQETIEQAYPSDLFFFERDGQLYSVVFLHTGNQEDWTLYEHFLESIVFD